MKKIFFVAIAAALLASCSNDDSTSTVVPSGLTPLAVSNASLNALTRSASTITTGSMGVFLLANVDSQYVAKTSRFTYSTTDSKWNATSTDSTIYLNSHCASICAYYPFNGSADPTAVAITSTSDTLKGDISYSVSNTTASNKNANISLTLNHALSRIQFKIVKDATYSGTGAISSISIENTAILTANTINITTGAYATGTAGTVTYNPAISSTSTTAVDSKVLMVPVATISGNVNVTFKVDGVNLTAALSGLTKLEAGKSYVINVTIKGTALTFSSVQVTDWVDATGGNIVPIYQ